ncbi:NAD/FAD-utilizing enzyme [Thalassotalea sp. HSM 43]|uniref:NAD/FAD-utilizing enzyme n=1 Tax=Thalassotalea sp. HSM 43 TaxID=2552945 RepID=UPI001081140E|nr:NAD/FAD-utilizing enzyme [Thalassotalea sp. HSM 43]QBY06016.1 NAD/FAD-utilizing enzyme [Thalassotalea sp. HSM 43]
MIRHYFSTTNLKSLKDVESDLIEHGFSLPQVHVLTEDDAAVQRYQLNEVESVLKKDVVHSTEIGALVGAIGAILVLTAAYLMGWTESAAGWLPFVFLAIVVLGFCTWEGGFIGIQMPNKRFERFKGLLRQGKHILMIDANEQQQSALQDVVTMHPALVTEGVGDGSSKWFIKSQKGYQDFMKMMP